MFKYDLHIHTSETSSCGRVPAVDMIKIYKEKGYQGVVITDHYRKKFFKKNPCSNWEEKVDDFLKGYRNAKEEGNKVGMDVLLGMEICFIEDKEPGNDYLVYGITEKILKESPNLLEGGIKELSKFCRENGLLIYQAHPLRSYCNLLSDLTLVDGLEVWNGNPRDEQYNDKVEEYAVKYGTNMISGSDYHLIGDENNGGIITSKRIKTNKDLINVLKNNKYDLYKGSK